MSEPDRPREAGPSTAGTLVFLTFGPLVWALHLSIIYAGHTLICTRQLPQSAMDVLVLVTTAAAVLAVLMVLALPGWSADLLGVRRHAEGRRTYIGMALVLAALSEVAILWGGATALLVSSCTPGR